MGVPGADTVVDVFTVVVVVVVVVGLVAATEAETVR